VQGKCLFNLTKPFLLCNPMNKTAVQPPRLTSAVIDESTALTTKSLLCYKVKTAKKFADADAADLALQTVGAEISPKQAKHIKHAVKDGNEVHTTPGNQFPGPVRVNTASREMVCVPTDIADINEVP
jgi:hypothetical protein